MFFQYRSLQLCQDALFSSFCCVKHRPTSVISHSKVFVAQDKIYMDSSRGRFRQSENKILVCDRKVRERNVDSAGYVQVLTSVFRRKENRSPHHASIPVPILKLYQCLSFN